MKRFKFIFDCPSLTGCAADRLFTVQQGDRSVAEYAVELGTLLAESGWDESALQNAYSRGLADRVCVSGMRPGDLNELVVWAIEMDNYQRQWGRERAFRFNPPGSPVRHPPSPPRASSSFLSTEPRSCDEEPMQLNRARLSTSKRRKRLFLVVCLYCGQGDQKTESINACRSAGRRTLVLCITFAGPL